MLHFLYQIIWEISRPPRMMKNCPPSSPSPPPASNLPLSITHHIINNTLIWPTTTLRPSPISGNPSIASPHSSSLPFTTRSI